MPDYRILVVDYEPRGVAQLRDPLHALGYSVTVVHDGMTAMKIYEELKPDLTLIEAMLPKKHGFEVCQELKKTPHGSSAPIVIVTSVYKGRKYRTLALHNYHCDDYLEKPVPEEVLVATVERLLKGRRTEAAPEPVAAPAPERVAAPQPAAAKETPQPAAARETPEPDEAELEISERLDELLGGDPFGGPKASSSDKILAFDRSGQDLPPSAGSFTGGGASMPDGGRRQASGASLALDHFHHVGHAKPDPSARQSPAPRRRGVAEQQPVPPPRRSARWLWVVALIVFLASSAIFLLVNWPL